MEQSQHAYCIYTPEEVAALRAGGEGIVLLDVRTPDEYEMRRIPGAVLLPVQEITGRWRELDPRQPTICLCEHGIRSERAADFLARKGFAAVATMRGGMSLWTGQTEEGSF